MIHSKSINAAVFSALLGTACAWAQSGKISSDLQQSIAGGKATAGTTQSSAGTAQPASGSLVDVIVRYKNVPSSTQFGNAASFGASIQHQYKHVSATHYRLPKSAVQALAADPNIVYMTLDRPVSGMFNPLSTVAATIHSDLANQSGYDGTGNGVAVIDSGIVNMPDFNGATGSRILKSQSFVYPTAADQF